MPGSHFCKCRDGFEPNLECRPIIDLGLEDGGIPDEVKGLILAALYRLLNCLILKLPKLHKIAYS